MFQGLNSYTVIRQLLLFELLASLMFADVQQRYRCMLYEDTERGRAKPHHDDGRHAVSLIKINIA